MGVNPAGPIRAPLERYQRYPVSEHAREWRRHHGHRRRIDSVVNPWLQHWQVPNLWVMGGSAFPQNGSENPTLTILAITLRAADALDRPLSEAPGRPRMKRREFLTLPAKSLGGVLLYTLAGEPVRLQAQTRARIRRVRCDSSRPRKRAWSHAACERIFPSDDSGPGATEAGVVIFIDRQLAGPLRARQVSLHKGALGRVRAGTRLSGQRKLRGRSIGRASRSSANFAESPSDEQDQEAAAIETYALLPAPAHHTIEGMFSDPMHGGNAGLIGWQLIGYPGPADELPR